MPGYDDDVNQQCVNGGPNQSVDDGSGGQSVDPGAGADRGDQGDQGDQGDYSQDTASHNGGGGDPATDPGAQQQASSWWWGTDQDGPNQSIDPASSESSSPMAQQANPVLANVPPPDAGAVPSPAEMPPEQVYADAEPSSDGVCEPNGGGGGSATNDGAGGAPNSGDGAEGASAGTGSSDGKSLWQKVKDWWNGDSNAPQAGSPAPEASPAQPEEPKAEAAPGETPTPDDKQAEPAVKKPSEMTPEERQADRTAKMEEYGKQSPEEKEARWAKQDGKLDKETWDAIQKMDPAARKQAMLQAGIDKLDYDDPRRAELEKIQNDMNGKDSRTGGAYTSGTAQTGCGGTADEMLKKGGDPTQPAFPGYIKGGEREMLPTTEGKEELKNAQNDVEKQAAKDKINSVTPKSGDVYELQNPSGDIHGHAGTFCVSSPDGKTWLTYDGGQQARTDDKQQIKLVTRNVSVDSQGRTIVGAPDTKSGTAADNGGRPVSGTYDYQKMYNKYPALHPPTASQ